jgi:hypothetical protein
LVARQKNLFQKKFYFFQGIKNSLLLLAGVKAQTACNMAKKGENHETIFTTPFKQHACVLPAGGPGG